MKLIIGNGCLLEFMKRQLEYFTYEKVSSSLFTIILKLCKLIGDKQRRLDLFINQGAVNRLIDLNHKF